MKKVKQMILVLVLAMSIGLQAQETITYEQQEFNNISAADGILSAVQAQVSDFHSWTITPPMGWNSWDCYGASVTEFEVKANADYMARHLKEYGWEYVVVDIRWYVDNEAEHGYNQDNPIYQMDCYGRYQPSPIRFPSSRGGKGFKPLADYVHKLGLKFGIHIMRGIPKEAVRRNMPVKGTKLRAVDIYSSEGVCNWLRDNYTVDAMKQGAQDYYNSLFDLYASWGVDFVKVDDLSYPYHKDEIEMLRHAIDQCGHPVVLSTSPGETPIAEAEHVKAHANQWRVIGDLWDNWGQVNELFDIGSRWIPHAGEGNWPDMDMLPLGHIGIRAEVGIDRPSGLTREEQRTLMALCAFCHSPLMFGGDLPTTDMTTLHLLQNRDLIHINQHSIGSRELKHDDRWVVWMADDPATGDKFLGVFNRQELLQADECKAFYYSELVSATGKAVASIEADLPHTKKLYLCVSDGGDGADWDHANWIEPRLTGPKGELRLSDLKWNRATAGWRNAVSGRAVLGCALNVGGQEYTEGIGTHAPSIIEYDLPEGYTHFSARGGLEQVASDMATGGGTVRFLLLADDGVKKAEAERLSINLGEMGLSGVYTVTDLWTGKSLGSYNETFTTTVQPHDVGLYRISPHVSNYVPTLEVGPFCSSEPYGVTLLADRSVAWVVSPTIDLTDTSAKLQDEALLPYPTSTADGSYNMASWTTDGKPFTITYGLMDKRTVGIVIASTDTVDVTLRWRQPFSSCKTLYWGEGNTLHACGFDAHTGQTYPLTVQAWPNMTDIDWTYNREKTSVCHVTSQQPTVIVLTVGEEPSAFTASEIQERMAEAACRYEQARVRAEGDWGDYVGAIAKTMNGSRLFSSLDRHIAHCIGRGWWIARQSPYTPGFVDSDDDQTAYFAWDTFFNANLASLEDPHAARETVRAMLAAQLPDGMVPNYAHWPCGNQYITPHRTNPPVATMNVWKLHQCWPDLGFLREVYPKLVKWHDWFRLGRCREGSMLLSWGNGRGSMYDAVLETGWDNTPSFDGSEMQDGLMNIYCVDLSALWAMDAEYLALVAEALGKGDDAARFHGEHEQMVSEMNDKLWNEKLGLYCHRFWQDNPDGTPRFATRITPLNFYPLICGAPSQKQARRMLNYLHNPMKFWGEYPVPTLPYDDSDYPGHYWRGFTWGPCNYLLWLGLQRYDTPKHLQEFVSRSVRLFMQNWNTPQQICGENYRSDHRDEAGKVGDDPHYTWGALLPLIGVEALIAIDKDMKPVPRNIGLKEHLVLKHIPVGGRLYTMENDKGKTTIIKEY